MRLRVLEAKYASIDEPYGLLRFKLTCSGVKRVRSGGELGAPNMKANGMRVTAEEVMTTRFIDGVRLAASRMERVTFRAGSIMSPS